MMRTSLYAFPHRAWEREIGHFSKSSHNVLTIYQTQVRNKMPPPLTHLL